MASQDDHEGKNQNGASDALLSSVGNPNPAGPPYEADAPAGVAGTSDDSSPRGEDGGTDGNDDASRESLQEKLSDDAGMMNPG